MRLRKKNVKEQIEDNLSSRMRKLESMVLDLGSIVKQSMMQKTNKLNVDGKVFDTSNKVAYNDRAIVSIPAQKFSMPTEDVFDMLKALKNTKVICSTEIPETNVDVEEEFEVETGVVEEVPAVSVAPTTIN